MIDIDNIFDAQEIHFNSKFCLILILGATENGFPALARIEKPSTPSK